MISSFDVRKRNYVPDTPKVVANTSLVQPGDTFTLTIEVPSEPGEYNFICTVPGHWRSMQGTFVVEPN